MAGKRRTLTVAFTAMLLFGLVPFVYFAVVEFDIAFAAQQGPTGEMPAEDPLARDIDNVAFGVGEKLTFDINYGFINAGTATMEVARLIDWEGRPAYQVVTRAESNKFFSSFYRVDDRVESIIDARGLFSWRFEKNLHEGSYSSDRLSLFDQHNNRAIYKEDTIEVPPFVQDALSVLYYTRTQALEVGESVFIDNFTDGKLYPLEVRVLDRETITVEAGTFDCLVVEPLMQSVGIFKHEGKLKVWVTDDRVRMPVQMKSKIFVGSITAELTDYELGEIDDIF